ncbi:hypothetical protein CP02DC14_1811 [Chlamydia psittaci 02DC14]|nr:hypothetical protein CP02DC18_1280 [Chlamydia psittaci 02DC18]EPJ19015.1 hypothetical protein CP02DC21_1452 [Chlamydia psittaci 02DC21]EPJ22971.1 hypothetical protein CP08DC60_1271 [Chlamydia psittaci 08DC60]EPJ27164.1 hypothetical protein CP03DC29_1237 [Chlamydia psittaci 03DC29]EPL02500.1 hypothetical protein CP02DC14_1811 [Chlamydia psittaci 02DC14]EPP30335.1 hypothetical protein CPC197_2278 [Chlamydia psittaci C1/97]EPP32755.1 hypothetical protein CPC698_1685 [Chlamydia psittaci C6/98]
MIQSHLVKPAFSRTKPVSAVLVWLSRSKPVSDGQNQFELFKTGLCRSKPD